ncbi:hypothetical protein Cgig2_010281 [Carnegiea gigantea]|uniref:Uncharacterized protein n=1 Tax=Carnegiea gigantea TaxID=171969 RepID=A0A9Q1Q592_9CARY|nr:hypothetical protein Cgig2_010281 [Carnegiea gigantea]
MVRDNGGEVRLSSGTMVSPKLLLFSSIGISVALHLPYVGQLLYDNPRNGLTLLPPKPDEHWLIQVVGVTESGLYLFPPLPTLLDFCRRTVSTIWHYYRGCLVDKVSDSDLRVIVVLCILFFSFVFSMPGFSKLIHSAPTMIKFWRWHGWGSISRNDELNFIGFLPTLLQVDTFHSPAQAFTLEDGVPNTRGRILGGSNTIKQIRISMSNSRSMRISNRSGKESLKLDARTILTINLEEVYSYKEHALLVAPRQEGVHQGPTMGGLWPSVPRRIRKPMYYSKAVMVQKNPTIQLTSLSPETIGEYPKPSGRFWTKRNYHLFIEKINVLAKRTMIRFPAFHYALNPMLKKPDTDSAPNRRDLIAQPPLFFVILSTLQLDWLSYNGYKGLPRQKGYTGKAEMGKKGSACHGQTLLYNA